MCTSKLGILEEINKFIETSIYQNCRRRNCQEEIESLSRQKLIKILISSQKSPNKEKSKIRWFSELILPSTQRRIDTTLIKCFKKIEEGTLSNLNNEANIILIPIPDKDTEKPQANFPKEHRWKNLNQILGN